MTRHDILMKSDEIVNGSREQDYGSPENNFKTISIMWNAYIKSVKRDHLEPYDVAAMLGLLKIARIAGGHNKEDNWIDLAGYAACGGELQNKDN